MYTPTYSKHLTIASGVHGMIDFAVPAGGLSLSDVVFVGAGGITDANRDLGSMKRMLNQRRVNVLLMNNQA